MSMLCSVIADTEKAERSSVPYLRSPACGVKEDDGNELQDHLEYA